MNLDLRTLILVLGITNILQVSAIGLQYRINRAYAGIGWWLLAFLSIAVGFIFTLLREVISIELITIITASTLTFSGPIFVYIGVLRFLGRKERRGWVLGSYIVFLLSYFYYTYVNNDINARSVVSAVMIAVYSLLTARALFTFKPRSIRASANFLAGAWLIQGSFFAFRALVLLTAAPIDAYFTPSLVQATLFLFTLMISTLVSFGLIIMVNQRSNAETGQAKEHFELIFHTSPDAALITRVNDGVIINVNEGFTALSGYSQAEALGKSSLAIDLYKDPADRQKIVAELGQKGFCDNYEATFLRKDGSEIHGVMSAKVILLNDVAHIISITRDIGARVQAEQQIRQLNAELEQRVVERTAHLAAANQEITTFTYSISHDLRAPLRAIVGFSQILLEDHHDQLDAEGQRLLQVIQKNTFRLEQLINDMRALLRVSQLELKFIRIDMTELVRQVYQETVLPEDQAQISFTLDPLPEVQADPVLLRLVWDNLISNAIKYTRPKEQRSIQIGCQSAEGQNIYFIKDNGVGFNPKYTHKLFGLFERLHKVDQFEGAGMGLAIVQRALQRHGGKVWAEGLLDQGATFFFSIPERQINHDE